MGDDVEEDRTEGEKNEDDGEPREDKGSLVLLRRRRGDTEDEGQTTK